MKASNPQQVGDLQTEMSVQTDQECETAESRFDPITGDWTIFAPNRNQRPDEYVLVGESINKNLQCPFCSGNESETPAAIWVGRIVDGICLPDVADQSADDWAVRVVPNRFPAISESPQRSAPQSPVESDSGLFPRGPIRGGHEVIVESRRHGASLSELDPTEVNLTFLAYRDRIRHWCSHEDVSYISTFKNVGERAGASLRHSHSQLIATDQMPAAVAKMTDQMHRHCASTGCCLQCDLIRGEIDANQRVVWKDDSLIAFCPFAGRLPMMLRITTLAHQPRFEDLDDSLIESVSRLVQRAVSWLEKIRPETAYNYCLSTCPPGYRDSRDSFHWSLDLFPRMTQVAGFEWSSGCMISPVMPESAATEYRRAARFQDPP